MSIKALTLYSADAQTATATGSSVKCNVEPGQDLAYVQIKIEAGTGGAVKVEIQGRASEDAGWVILDKADHSTEASVTQSAGAATEVIFPVQLMPYMRAKHSGSYTATDGNDIDVWLLASGQATRADS